MFPWNHKNTKCFFCGIGGVGMNPMAHLIALRGGNVSGSDCTEKSVLDDLRKHGVKCYVGHKADNVDDADVFIYSTAIKSDNPELIRAKEKNIKLMHRAELLASLVNNSRGVNIAGSHGKTTVSALTSVIFNAAELDPTAVVGGYIQMFGAYYKNGKSDWVVVETDESDGSFQIFDSEIAVVLNIDTDHMDYYKDLNALIKAFGKFISNIKPGGTLVYNGDDLNVQKTVAEYASEIKLISCSVNSSADYSASDIKLNKHSSEFIAREDSTESEFKIKLNVPGKHNVLNALQAIAAARTAGATISSIQKGCELFKGVDRRFQFIGKFCGANVIDDYAHHPKEIEVTIQTAKTLGKKIVTVFQPHRYTRTEKLFDEFTDILGKSGELILTDIYSAGETPGDVTGQTLYESVKKINEKAIYIKDLDNIPDKLKLIVGKDSIILFLGAGTISNLAHRVVDTQGDRL